MRSPSTRRRSNSRSCGFFLPPPDDRREIRNLGRPLTELYLLLLGRDDQLDPVYDRLRDVGFSDPTPLEEAFERITGETV